MKWVLMFEIGLMLNNILSGIKMSLVNRLAEPYKMVSFFPVILTSVPDHSFKKGSFLS